MEVSDSDKRRSDALRHANKRPSGAFALLGRWARIAILSLALFVVIRAFGLEAFKIASGSMEHTLLAGDFLLVNKLVYGAGIPGLRTKLPAVHAPHHGDVIVFIYPIDPTRNYVKRIAGEPGDTVEMRAGLLYRNSKRVVERYVHHTPADPDAGDSDFRWQTAYLVGRSPLANYHPSRDNWGPLIVPPENYFVLGDNRENSSDSRYWGFVPDSLVRGQPMMVYYSYVPDSGSRLDWLTRVRWKRFGEIVH